MRRTPTKVLYYDVTDEKHAKRLGRNWQLTMAIDKESLHYMKLYEGAINIRMATLENLLEYTHEKGEMIEGFFELKEGYYQLIYEAHKNKYGKVEVNGEYKKVGDKRAVVA